MLLCRYKFNNDKKDELGVLGDLTGNSGEFVDGEFSKCLSIKQTDSLSYIKLKQIPDLKKGFSVNFWAKIDDAAKNENKLLMGFRKTDTVRYYISVHNGTICSGYGNLGWGSTSSYDIEENKWVNISFVAKSDKSKLYIDGVLVEAKTSAYEFVLVDEYVYVGSGDWGESKSEFEIANLTMYDHALSLQEVLDLKKGLCLHFPLNRPLRSADYIENEVFINRDFADKGEDYFTKTFEDEVVSWTTGLSLRNINVEPGEWYTWSLDVKYSRLDSTYFDTNCFCTESIGNDFAMETIINMPNKVVQPNKWTRVWVKVKIKEDVTSPYISHAFCPRIQENEEPLTVHFRNSVFEKGINPLMKPFQAKSKQITDESGLGNHGLITVGREPELKEGGPRGKYMHFENMDCITTAYSYPSVMTKFTYQTWIRTTDNEAFNVMGGDFGSNTTNSMAIMSGKLCLHVYASADIYADNNYALTTKSINDNEWHHCVITSDGEKIKSFLDGKKDREHVFSMTSSLRRYFALGLSATGLESYEQRRFVGDLCDVKVFATALSDQEVLDEYKAAKIGSNWLKAKEFEEREESIELYKGELMGPVSTNEYKYIMQEPVSVDLSKFAEPDNTLSNSYLEGYCYISDLTYPIGIVEFCKTNNTKGIRMIPLPYYGSSWVLGWNYFRTKIQPEHYCYLSTTDWTEIEYFEFYHNGPIPTENPPNTFVGIRDLKITKVYSDKTSISSHGTFSTKEIKEDKEFTPTCVDYSIWNNSSNYAQDWYKNGGVSENRIELQPNPRGIMDVVWACVNNDDESNGDGGFHSLASPIDNTKKYRYSCWVKRTYKGDGSTYFGLAYGDVARVGYDEEVKSNPYFASFTNEISESILANWVLFVGYVHPHDYTGEGDSTIGFYNKNGKIQYSRWLNNFRWTPTTTQIAMRAYLYDSTNPNEKQYFYQPRFEVCDGTEPTIEQLINQAQHRPLIEEFYGIQKPKTVNKNGIYVGEIRED